MERCHWVTDHPLYIHYHDHEWGVPVYDDRLLFELLMLEGAQAGLNWLTILKKRQHYRDAFDQFDVEKIAAYDDAKIQGLLGNPGIVRNRLKIQAAIKNAQAYLALQAKYGGATDYLWSFVGGGPIKNHWTCPADVPVTSPQSDALAKALKQQGFRFVGSTICYAFMQAVGMVNDHTVHCFCY